MEKFDVIVVGAGNAAMAAALSARQEGLAVLVLEASDEQDMGGNTRYAAGQMRTVYNGVDDLKRLVPDLSESEIAQSDFGVYRREDYLDDIARLTQYRCDPDLVEVLVDNSLDTLEWMKQHGVRFQVSYGRQASKVDGRFRFWGGLPCEVWGGGVGLLEAYYASARRHGIEIRLRAYVKDLIVEAGQVAGVLCEIDGKPARISSKAVILACGGFEASAEMRARYLGPNWDLAKVRGSRYNTGQGLKMALEAGADS